MCRQKDEGDVGGGGGWGAGKRGRTDARAGLGLTGAWLIPAGWPRVAGARDKHPVGANFLEQGVTQGVKVGSCAPERIPQCSIKALK